MTIKDLKVGMKVYIREDLKTCEEYGGCYFTAEMQALTGHQTIEDFSKFSHNFRLKGDGCWWFSLEMIDWDKTEEINNKETRLTYDGTTLEGQINGKEIKVVKSHEDKEDLEKAIMMGLLKSFGYNYGDVKKLQSEIKKVWRPKFMEKYYYIMSNLEVNYIYNDGYSIDERRIQVGNCFKTEEEAEKMAVEVGKIFKK